ncbi:MAG: hypothetical protein JWN26_125 [Candidatus Saccharibacteria bacterium]|nr:hypothetical protein [Candidatus Saccharibacteria bacterium]
MVSSIQIRIIIGIAAVVWLIVALMAGNGDQSLVALRTVSVAGSVTTLLVLAYDRWIWGWKLVRKFTGKPRLNGTWKGSLQSDFQRDGKTIDPIPTIIRIKQTDSSILVTLFTGESSSVTELSKLIKESDGRWRLTFTYSNTPRQSLRKQSDRHSGVCDLYIATGKDHTLMGYYFTSRSTSGEMIFREWSKKMYSDAATANDNTDFRNANPFA